MHKALKKMYERASKKLQYLFYNRSIEIEKPHFSLRWTTLLAQVANQLEEADYLVELFSSASQTYLKFRLKDGHTIQLQLNREYEDEPLLVVQFGSFDPNYDLNMLRPTFSEDDFLRTFSRFSGMAYFHPLIGTDEEVVTFITQVAIKLHQIFNK